MPQKNAISPEKLLDPAIYRHVKQTTKSVQNVQKLNDDQPSAEEDQTQNIAHNDPVAFADFTSQNGWEEFRREKFSIMAIAEAFEVKTSAQINDEDLNGHIVKLKAKTLSISDSGSPMFFLNETTARRLQQNENSTGPQKYPYGRRYTKPSMVQ